MTGAKTLLEIEGYLGEYEPEKYPEQLFIEFADVISVYERFNEYCLATGVLRKYSKLKRRKSEIQRRRLFIHWYVQAHPEKSSHTCVLELARMLFVSKSTVINSLFDYRKI